MELHTMPGCWTNRVRFADAGGAVRGEVLATGDGTRAGDRWEPYVYATDPVYGPGFWPLAARHAVTYRTVADALDAVARVLASLPAVDLAALARSA